MVFRQTACFYWTSFETFVSRGPNYFYMNQNQHDIISVTSVSLREVWWWWANCKLHPWEFNISVHSPVIIIWPSSQIVAVQVIFMMCNTTPMTSLFHLDVGISLHQEHGYYELTTIGIEHSYVHVQVHAESSCGFVFMFPPSTTLSRFHSEWHWHQDCCYIAAFNITRCFKVKDERCWKYKPSIPETNKQATQTVPLKPIWEKRSKSFTSPYCLSISPQHQKFPQINVDVMQL